jgi:predicted MFS family arabinose efflux permease
MSTAAFKESWQLLRTRRFGTFWVASLLSNIGTWAQQMAQPWLMLSLGASPFLLGLDSFALAAPVLLLTLVGGALADASDRRQTILRFQFLQMLCPIAVVLLLAFNATQPWMIIVLSLIVGITDGLSMPSFQSIVPSIVEKEQIANGIALNSTQFNLSRILGPAIAGVLMTSVGAVGAFAVSAFSYVPFVLVALWVLPRLGVSEAPKEGFHWRGLLANVREVLKRPALRGVLLTVFFSSLLCAPLLVFCPVLVQESFHSDVSHFGLVMGCFGAGGLCGAIVLLCIDAKRDRRPISNCFSILYGVVLVLVSLVNVDWGLQALFALAGFSMTMSNTSANTLLQSASSTSVRGQTVSMFMLAMRGGMALGALLTGVTVAAFGVRHSLLINGLLAIGVQSGIALYFLQQPADI